MTSRPLPADAPPVRTGPSPEGIAELRAAAAELGYRPRQRRRRRWPRWLTARRLALIVVADVVAGSVGWHYLAEPHPGAAAAAVLDVAHDASHNDWSGVYDRLCRSDQAQLDESDLATAGRAALLSLGELDHVTVTAVRSIALSVGPVHWPAAQVSGQIVPVVGQPSGYTVTVVRELGGWRTCLSAGGYRSAALGVDVPLGSGSLQF